MRIQKKVRVFLSILAIGMSSASVAHAVGPLGLARPNPLASQMHRVPTGHDTFAPFAYIVFCAQNLGDCAAAQPAVARWGGHAKRMSAQINRRVNRLIQPVNDALETWSADVRASDCEDRALTKRRELIRHGIAASALKTAVVFVTCSPGNAVFMQSPSGGGIVLDNRNNRLKTPTANETHIRQDRIGGKHPPLDNGI